MNPGVVIQTDLPGLPAPMRGKVRDIYKFDEQHFLIVATDRISAFDVVMANGIPGKGRILTQMSAFWFNWIKNNFPFLSNHFITADWEEIAKCYPELQPFGETLADRSMLVIKAKKVLPVEIVVRGYLYGSAWKDYQQIGRVCGVELPPGLRMADKLERPILTPATKVQTGHDENIDRETMIKLIGRKLTVDIETVVPPFYKKVARYTEERGIIIADSKFEFGLNRLDRLMLIDEVFTPDSSRFWPKEKWLPGQEQPSFDKQYVRDYLEGLFREGKWDKNPPGPELPAEVIEETARRYQEAFARLMS